MFRCLQLFMKDLDTVLQVYERLFTDSSPERIDALFRRLDPRQTGYVDYLEWSRLIDLQVAMQPITPQGTGSTPQLPQYRWTFSKLAANARSSRCTAFSAC